MIQKSKKDTNTADSSVAISDLFEELSRQYTEIKVCHDDEDGYFLKCESGHNIDAWVTMDDDTETVRKTVSAAVKAAVDYHNSKCEGSHNWRRPIPSNSSNRTKNGADIE